MMSDDKPLQRVKVCDKQLSQLTKESPDCVVKHVFTQTASSAAVRSEKTRRCDNYETFINKLNKYV